MPYDVDFLRVGLLLACDGADNSTTFTDLCPTPKTVTAPGNTKVMSGALLLDGDGDKLTVSAHAGLGYAGDFTLEGFFYPTTSQTSNRFLLDLRVAAGNSCMVWCSQSGATHRLGFSDQAGGSFISGGAWTTNAWSHFAVTRSGSTVRGFIAGALAFTTTDSRAYASPQGVYVGSSASAGQGAIGSMKWVRLSSFARYTAAFTPPTAPLPDRAPQLSGNVKNASGVNAARLVRAVRDDTGALSGVATSDAGTGNYTINCTSDGAHTINAYPAAGESLPVLTLGGVVPL